MITHSRNVRITSYLYKGEKGQKMGDFLMHRYHKKRGEGKVTSTCLSGNIAVQSGQKYTKK